MNFWGAEADCIPCGPSPHWVLQYRLSPQGGPSDGSWPIPPHPGEQPAESRGPCHSAQQDQVLGRAAWLGVTEEGGGGGALATGREPRV